MYTLYLIYKYIFVAKSLIFPQFSTLVQHFFAFKYPGGKNYHHNFMKLINTHKKFFLKTRYIYLSFTFDNCVFDPDVLVEYGHVDFHDWQSLCRNMCKCMDVHLYHAGTLLGLWYSQSKTLFCCKTYLFLFAFTKVLFTKIEILLTLLWIWFFITIFQFFRLVVLDR